MTNITSYSWRYTRLDQIMPKSRLIDDLHAAGYYTAGDVLDSDPEDIADDVRGIGLKRAIWLRDKVYDAIRPQLLASVDDQPDWVVVPQHVGPSLKDRAAECIAPVCVGVAVGLAIFFVLRWLL